MSVKVLSPSQQQALATSASPTLAQVPQPTATTQPSVWPYFLAGFVGVAVIGGLIYAATK